LCTFFEADMKKDGALTPSMIRRLQAAGCPIPTGLSSESPPDLIVEVARSDITIAYDLRGRIEFVFAVRITNRSYARLRLQGFLASVPWDGNFFWPRDPRIDSPKEKFYRRETGLKFSFDEVLNHRLGQEGEIEPSGHLDGVILAFSMPNPIPWEYRHGSFAPADLGVVDQFERPHWSNIEMLIDRNATMKPTRPRGSRSTLFDGPKPENPLWRKPLPDSIETESEDRFVELEKARRAAIVALSDLGSSRIDKRKKTSVGQPRTKGLEKENDAGGSLQNP
jgi:hypothetical protein